ncbi:aromatic di-alanine and TPR containing protein [Ceratobasidium sp. AG-Ba]|nr:aromatic di-alanine and TPR containing protein [Ceratobasidium sp. AG-Ba]QRV99571.1 aromatic di-alanine and TPR containing protein [Ceratobasidium sp. AG-Ba]QRW14092.1 aromatic di-alanine and TPR containing protein [Ceratobasidium sp. AG-Ba]
MGGRPRDLESICLRSLEELYMKRFRRLGNHKDIDNMVESASDAMQRAPREGIDRTIRLGNAGVALARRFDKLGQFEDLEKAIKYTEEALDHCGKEPIAYLFHGNLGTCFLNCLRRPGEKNQLQMLQMASKHLETALQMCPVGHPTRHVWLANLGVAYSIEYEIDPRPTEGPSAIDKAIRYHSDAMELVDDIGTPVKNDTKMAVNLLNLGHSYAARFQRQGETPDLDNAIGHIEKAMSLTKSIDLDNQNLLNTAVMPKGHNFLLHAHSPCYLMVQEYANYDPALVQTESYEHSLADTSSVKYESCDLMPEKLHRAREFKGYSSVTNSYIYD